VNQRAFVFSADRPLLNVSQAAPVDPPPLALRQALAEAKKRGFVIRQLSAGDQQRLMAIEAALGE
jgi:hypothetical protein